MWKQEWLNPVGLSKNSRTLHQRRLGDDWGPGAPYLSSTTQPPGLLLKLPMPRPDPKTSEVRISGGT